MEQHIKSEILMNVSPYESRVAIIENGVLQEVHIERAYQRGLVGNIYKGKITRVLPGMQAAFVDIGLDRAGFLHISDVMPLSADDEQDHIDLNSSEADVRRWLKEGQVILVQVMKDPLGAKGARLSAHLSLASRYLVYMPELDHIGVSLRIENENERSRLQNIMHDILNHHQAKGFIMRTVAEGVESDELAKDVAFLERLWQEIQDASDITESKKVVHQDLDLEMRILRDYVNANVDRIRVDDIDTYSQLCDFADKFIPGVREKLDYYAGEEPIFDMYGVEQEIEKAIKREVSLKSGGYLTIDQTEAMTTIDVNTGRFVGHINLEETIFKTNLEAAKVIGRQLRLRNLGGIIVIDFIDMNEQHHRDRVVQTLEKVLKRDYARTYVSSLSNLGLVEMTRKRTRENLLQLMSENCPTCKGKGRVKSVQTICYEIFREIHREAQLYTYSGFLLVAAPKVIDALTSDEFIGLGQLEIDLGRPIKLQSEIRYTQETYDIVLL